MRLFSVLAVIVLALVLAGCSGEKLSVKAYRGDLDKYCAASAKFNQGLPQRQSDENLTTKQVEKLAKRRAAKFVGQVKELNPPDELADADHALTKVLGRDPGELKKLDDITNYLEDVRKAYEGVGADGCADGAKRSLEQVKTAGSAQS